MYGAGPPPPPPSFYQPSTTSANLLSSYFTSGLANSTGSTMPMPPSHLANPLGLSPYMSAAFPQASNSSIHSFLAAIEAASAVAQLQQQQQHLNNNNHSPEIKRPIPHIAAAPKATGQAFVGVFKKTDIPPSVPFSIV